MTCGTILAVIVSTICTVAHVFTTLADETSRALALPPVGHVVVIHTTTAIETQFPGFAIVA